MKIIVNIKGINGVRVECELCLRKTKGRFEGASSKGGFGRVLCHLVVII